MSSLVEKTMLLGLGVFTLTRDKVAAVVDDLVKSGEVQADESRKLIDDLLARGEKEQKELRKLIEKELDKARGTIVPVTKEDFDTLRAKVDDLETRLNAGASKDQPAE